MEIMELMVTRNVMVVWDVVGFVSVKQDLLRQILFLLIAKLVVFQQVHVVKQEFIVDFCGMDVK
jgi:hypothetical protein